MRIAEFGTVYRYEQSGELNGLARVRGFTQDDAHIFCTQDQIKSEFVAVIDLVMICFQETRVSTASQHKSPYEIKKTDLSTSDRTKTGRKPRRP